MDLATLDLESAAERGFELELRHPATAAPLGAFITVYGADSEVYQNALADLQRAIVEEFQASGKAGRPRERVRQDKVDLAVAATKTWRNVTLDGVELAPTQDNFRKLYGRKGMGWIREQVDAAVENRANFLPAASKG
jgi:hypothetical protein